MSSINEEQLLSDLLDEIARADAHIMPPGDLASRALWRWDTRETAPAIRRTRVIWAFAIAAAVLLTVGVSLRFSTPTVPTPAIVRSEHRPPVVVAEVVPPEVATTPRRRPTSARRSTRQPAIATTPREFIDITPLGPTGPDHSAGSFQLVPVRINNTPAHLLLGEDGMAQGILWR